LAHEKEVNLRAKDNQGRTALDIEKK